MRISAVTVCCNARDSVAILTEWNEFRALGFDKLKKVLKTPLMVDIRIIYRPAVMAQCFFAIAFHFLAEKRAFLRFPCALR
jgi:UDPglucose 6-dehydrogenase